MQATFNIPAFRILQLQLLVKDHNLRFVGNPYLVGEYARVCISSDHLPSGGCNAFFAEWASINTPIREVVSPRWKQLLRRFGINFKSKKS